MTDTAGGSTSAPAGDAAIPVSPAPNVVHLACRCPGTPHPFDVVTLRERVTNRMGIAAAAAMQRAGADQVAMESELGMVWLRYGIVAWTFHDDGPVPCDEPVDPELIERWLPFSNGGYDVLEVGNALYAEEVFRPFRDRLSRRSPDGRGAKSISPTKRSGRTRRKPSRPSSRTSSAGKRSGA